MELDIKDFYDFDSKGVMTTVQAYLIRDEYKGESPHDRLIIGNYKNIHFPVKFKQHRDSGKHLRDMLDTGWPSCHLISNTMLNLLQDNNLTGWQTYPIVLEDKKKNRIEGYHGFSIIGRCSPAIDWKKSELIERINFEGGPICRSYKGYHLDFDQWDNSDFFMPGNHKIIITKRAMKIMKEAKLTNVSFENLADGEYSEDVAFINIERKCKFLPEMGYSESQIQKFKKRQEEIDSRYKG